MKADNTIQFVCAASEQFIPANIQDNSVQLIYLDPPFFKQNEMKSYSGYTKTAYSFSDKWDSLDVYLDFIKDILVKCRQKLSENGLVFLHCDTSANHYLRVLLDNVFGKNLFVNEIIWTYKRWSNSAARLLESHQNIYVYSKSKNYKFNRIMTEYSPTTNVDQILQARARNENGVVVYKRDKNSNVLPVEEKKGVPLRDVWEIPFLNPKAKERTGYPTQKPVELMDRIVKISCDKGDTILDPFCGSGSMGIAAYMNGCNYMGIDKNIDAINLCNRRKQDYYISESAVKDGDYSDFSNLETEIKSFLVSINAIPVERNKGIDGIYSSSEGLIGIRFQRRNESLSDVLILMEKAAKEKPISKKIIVKTNDTALFDTVPKDVFVLESLLYKFKNVTSDRSAFEKAMGNLL
jgi:site-specific DNA-methyltransferase (adenine-specific)